MKVFGIDPGSIRTGYGCIESDGQRHHLIACGAIRTVPRAALANRLLQIHDELRQLIDAHHPDCVVIDFMMGRNEAVMIAQNLRKNAEYTETVLVGLLSDEDNSSGFDRSVFNETFRKPFDVALLAERIRTLVGRRKQLA